MPWRWSRLPRFRPQRRHREGGADRNQRNPTTNRPERHVPTPHRNPPRTVLPPTKRPTGHRPYCEYDAANGVEVPRRAELDLQTRREVVVLGRSGLRPTAHDSDRHHDRDEECENDWRVDCPNLDHDRTTDLSARQWSTGATGERRGVPCVTTRPGVRTPGRVATTAAPAAPGHRPSGIASGNGTNEVGRTRHDPPRVATPWRVVTAMGLGFPRSRSLVSGRLLRK